MEDDSSLERSREWPFMLLDNGEARLSTCGVLDEVSFGSPCAT